MRELCNLYHTACNMKGMNKECNNKVCYKASACNKWELSTGKVCNNWELYTLRPGWGKSKQASDKAEVLYIEVESDIAPGYSIEVMGKLQAACNN